VKSDADTPVISGRLNALVAVLREICCLRIHVITETFQF